MTILPLAAQVKMHGNRPVLFVNDEARLPLFYALTDVPGGRWSWEELPAHNLAQFARIGFSLFQVDLALNDLWREDDSLDLDLARRQLRGVLNQKSDAAIMVRLNVSPPRWWRAKHSEENARFSSAEGVLDGEPDAPGFQRFLEDDPLRPQRTSLASQRWRDECGAALARLCRELSQTEEGGALIALQIAGGVYGEWHYWGFMEHEPDVSEPMQRRWRAFSGDPGEYVPTYQERGEAGDGLFRDPERDARVIAYGRCQHECVAEAIEHFARIAKDSWPRPLVVGAFYGYFFSTFGRDLAGGHLEVESLLTSSHLDFLCAPGASYPDASEPGDFYRSRALVESCRLHGKLWLDEVDQENSLSGYRETTYQADVAAAVAKTTRNMASAPLRGHGLWFYDFGPSGFHDARARFSATHGASGWWDVPELLRAIAHVKERLESDFAQPYRSGADVLLVGDTRVYYHLASVPQGDDPVSHALVNWAPLGFARAGAVWDAVHLCDLERVQWNNYRVVAFLNTWRLSEAQRRFITQNVAREGRQLLWFYAPGYSDGTRNDNAWVAQVTGFDLERADGQSHIEVALDDYHTSYCMESPSGAIWPLFSPRETAATRVLGRFADGRPAWARQQFADHEAFFVSLPAFDASPFRALLRHTKAHRWNETGDIFMADGVLLALHTREGGSRPLLWRDGTHSQVRLPPGPATVLFDQQSKAVVWQSAVSAAPAHDGEQRRFS